MRKILVVFALLVVGLMCGCSNISSIPNPNFTLTAREFRNDFWNLNEYKNTERKYNGKVIRMTGNYCYMAHKRGVYSMTLAYYPRPYNLGIYALFSENDRSRLSQLIPGEEVVVQGTAKWVVYPPDCTLLLTNATLLKP